MEPSCTVITFGTFDVFHIGHLKLLQRARQMGTRLIVGVSSDMLNIAKKGHGPVIPQHDRMQIIRALRCVDDVFLEESLEKKVAYIQAAGADILVMGDDWAGKFDELSDLCRVCYLSRTPNISSTELKQQIQKLTVHKQHVTTTEQTPEIHSCSSTSSP